MADLIIKFVVSPALTCGSPISYVEEINQHAEEKSIAVLKIVPSLEKVSFVLIGSFLICHTELILDSSWDSGE